MVRWALSVHTRVEPGAPIMYMPHVCVCVASLYLYMLRNVFQIAHHKRHSALAHIVENRN